jgi:hypothetical protein
MGSKEKKLAKELRQARYEGQDAAAQGVEPKDEAPGIFKNNEHVRLRNKVRREAAEHEKAELAFDEEDDESR